MDPSDSYRCPQGGTRRHFKTDYSKCIHIDMAPEKACASCPLCKRYTDGLGAWQVTNLFDKDLRERPREPQTPEAHRKALRKL